MSPPAARSCCGACRPASSCSLLASLRVLNHRTMVSLVDSEQTEVSGAPRVHPRWRTRASGSQSRCQAGADQVEFDVMETKDGKFVVMHDANLQRLAGKNLKSKTHPG